MRFIVDKIAQEKGIEDAASLSRLANIGQATVYELWNNRRSDVRYSTLKALATVLDVMPDDLVQWDVEPDTNPAE